MQRDHFFLWVLETFIICAIIHFDIGGMQLALQLGGASLNPASHLTICLI